MTIAMKPPAAPSQRRPSPRPEPRRGLFARLLFAVPVLGAMLREIAEGREGSFVWFAFSLFGGVAAMGLAFGLPGLTLGMLVATLAMFLVIVSIAGG